MTETKNPLSPLEILLIEDNDDIRDFFTMTFLSFGYSVTAFGNGRESIDDYIRRYDADNPFDVVVTDWGLKDISGEEVVRAIKTKSKEKPQLTPQGTPVIVVTGYEKDVVYRRFLETPESRPELVLKKPILPPDFETILATYQQQKNSRAVQ
ncbi:response regulator [Candidatus Woesearchaeota archaeon]|nr:response regulator [Candidatus Woesearchaeota archaeon]